MDRRARLGAVTNILVTGARGQLGGHLLRRAEASGIPARGVGSDELDITDHDAVLAQVEAGSVVINWAAYTAVPALCHRARSCRAR